MFFECDPEQECIPVGYVLAARWPYPGVSFAGGVCPRGGGGLLRGWWSGPGGSVWSRGGGGGIPACTEADPPVNRITHTCKNIT